MTIEEAIRDRLVAATAAAANVGRVWQLLLPQHPAYPALRVQLIDEQREQHFRGLDSVREARVQVDSFVSATMGTDPYDTAATLAEAVVDALTPEPFSMGSPALEVLSVKPDDRRPFYESDRQLIRLQQDFKVWYRAA